MHIKHIQLNALKQCKPLQLKSNRKPNTKINASSKHDLNQLPIKNLSSSLTPNRNG